MTDARDTRAEARTAEPDAGARVIGHTDVLRAIDPEDVAKALVRAVAKGKRSVWLPKTAALAPALVELPRRVVGLATADIKHSTPPG